MKTLTLTGVVVALLLVVSFALGGSPVFIVEEGSVVVKTRLGQAISEHSSGGVKFKLPFVEQVHRVNVRQGKYSQPVQCTTSDNQLLTGNMIVTYRLTRGKIKDAWSEYKGREDIEEVVIFSSIQECADQIVSGYTVEEYVQNRVKIFSEIQDAFNTFMTNTLAENDGLVFVTSVMPDLIPSEDFLKSVEDKMKADQEKAATIARAQGEAESRLLNATSEAESIKLKAEAIQTYGRDVVDYEIAQKWNGILPVMTSGATPMVNVSSLVEGSRK